MPGVPAAVLDPRATWSHAGRLRRAGRAGSPAMFADNFSAFAVRRRRRRCGPPGRASPDDRVTRLAVLESSTRADARPPSRHAVRTRHRSRDSRPAAHARPRSSAAAAPASARRRTRHVCPVCLGFPGSLPVLNRRAVELAVKASLALGCEVQPVSVFARKNYFYPDLPKGYQISQYELPLALNGHVTWEHEGETLQVGILRVHMEEDAGKSLHEGFPDSDRATYVDCNRAGVPLVEIVTRPDLRSARGGGGFLQPPARRARRHSASTTATSRRGACAATPTSRSGRSAAPSSASRPRSRTSTRSGSCRRRIEHEIERQIERRLGRRAGAAGDPAVGRGRRSDDGHAQQGRSARLPLLPRAGSAAAAYRRRRDRAPRAPSCRSCPTRAGAASSSSTRCRPTTPAC